MEDIVSFDLITLSLDGEEFLLNVFRSQPHVLQLTLTNGVKVWKGTVGIDNKPASRRNESDDTYFGLLMKYLQTRHAHLEYSLEVQQEQMCFSLKEAIAGMNAKAILMKTSLDAVDDAAGSLLGLLRTACDVILLKNATVHSLHDIISNNEATIQSLNTEIFKFSEEKKTFQDNLLRNMTLLLNTKKEEVANIRSTFAAVQSHNDNDAEASVTQTSVAPKTKLKRGRKPKGWWWFLCVEMMYLGTESLATPIIGTSQVTTQATTLATQDTNMSQLLQPVGVEVTSADLQRHLSQESTDEPSLKRLRSEATDTQESYSSQTNGRPKRAAVKRSKLRAAIDSDDDENDLMSYV